MRIILSLICVVFLCVGCAHKKPTEKYQTERNNIVYVSDRIVRIPTGDLLFSSVAIPYIIDKYLLIADTQSKAGKFINIFDKNDFSHIVSSIRAGRGPGEIASLGNIAFNAAKNEAYISDHGKGVILSYNIDSLVGAPEYIPEVKTAIDGTIFPDRYVYISDTLSIARMIEPAEGFPGYTTSAGRFDMTTGEVQLFPYKHPDTDNRIMIYNVSPEHGLYVECYYYYDLMSIFTLDGKLKYNIYGPAWTPKISYDITYYEEVLFCGDKILAAFSGNSSADINANFSTKLLAFDLDGNYLKTLDLGYKAFRFAYDDSNNRLIICLDDDMSLAYLPLDNLF